MSEILITFIVPAYNAAPYIKACVDSIFSLDLKGHGREVVVVDDGSEDDTAEILAQCCKEHEALKVMTQRNLGLSMARNAAMNVARGKYLCFVDADDELDYECDIAQLLQTVEDGEADIIGIDVEQVGMDGVRAPYRRYKPIYNKVYAPAREFMRGRNLMPCAWAYLYRRDFIETEGLRFMPGVYHEDEDFSVRAFTLAASFVAVKASLYVRVLRNDSITTTDDTGKQRKRLRDMVEILKGLDAFMEKRNMECRQCAQCKMDYIVVDLLRMMISQRHTPLFRKEITEELKRMGKFPLRWRWNAKYIAFNVMTRMMYMFR